MNKFLEELPAMIVALGALALAGLLIFNHADYGIVLAVAEFPLIYYFQKSAFSWTPQQSPPLILSSPPLQTQPAQPHNIAVSTAPIDTAKP